MGQQFGDNKAQAIEGAKDVGAATLQTALGVLGAQAPEVVPALYKAAGTTLKNAMESHPVITKMLMAEALSQARKIPMLGKFIPPMAEMIPFLIGGGSPEAPGAEAESAAPEAEAESEAPSETPDATPTPAPKVTQAAVEKQLNSSLGNEPLKPGVSLRNQVTAPAPIAELPKDFTPVDSAIVKGYKYNPESEQLTTVTNDGQSYTHSEVTPEEFKHFEANDSTGKAWNVIRSNHVLTLKNGIPFKPVGSQSVLRNATPVTVEADPADTDSTDTDAPDLPPAALGGSAPKQPQALPAGMVEQGNINLNGRPVVKNNDGTVSTEYSTSFGDEDGHEILVPTVVKGKFLTPDGKKPQEGSDAEKAMFKAAQQHYEDTGENLGKFDNPDHADAYADIVHSRQMSGDASNKTLVASRPMSPLEQSMSQKPESSSLDALSTTPTMPRQATGRDYLDNPDTRSAIEGLYQDAQGSFNPYGKDKAEHLIALGQDGKTSMSSTAAPGDVRSLKTAVPNDSQAIIHSHPSTATPVPSPQDYKTATQLGKPNFVLSKGAIYVAMPGTDPNTTSHIKVADVSPAKHGKLNVKWNQ